MLMLAMATQQLFAQSVIDRFFEKYEDDRSFTLVSVTPKMFSMFSKLDINTGEGQQFMSVVKSSKACGSWPRKTPQTATSCIKKPLHS